MSRLAIFESKAVSVIFAGLSFKDGRSDPFFKITANGPAYKMEGPGADGQVTRCGTNDNTYKVQLTFKGASAENAKLSALHIADRKATNGAGVAPMLIKDANGSTLIATDRAWITGMAEKTLGVSPSDVTWEFDAIFEPGSLVVGGN